MVTKSFKKSEIIFEEGVVELCMYEILSGKVAVYANYDKDDEEFLTELKSGQVLGEMGLLEARPRSATAIAMEDVELRQITAGEFSSYFEENPDEIYEIMKQLGDRIRELSEDYTVACRAAAELVDTKKSGNEFSDWFKAQIEKFKAALG